MSTINSVSASLHSSSPGVALTTVTLNGKRYRVSICLEDDQGKALPMPARFEEETMKKTEQLILSLFAAHRANGLETFLTTTEIQGATSTGLKLQDGKVLSHDFTIESCKSKLAPENISECATLANEAGKDATLLKAQDLWDRAQQLILADKSLKDAPHTQTPPLVPTNNATPTPPKNDLPIIPNQSKQEHQTNPIEPSPPITPTQQTHSNASNSTEQQKLIDISPLQKFKKLKEIADNPYSIIHSQSDFYKKLERQYQAYKKSKEKKKEQVEPFEIYLKHRLAIKKRKWLEMKQAAETKARDMIIQFNISKNVTKEEAVHLIDDLKNCPLFEANTFHGYVYQTALSKKIPVDSHDSSWGEHHAFDDLTVFFDALTQYLEQEWPALLFSA